MYESTVETTASGLTLCLLLIRLKALAHHLDVVVPAAARLATLQHARYACLGAAVVNKRPAETR